MGLWLWAQVEYDGTAFSGFQIQKGERTVQGEIERALKEISQRDTRVQGAGRTDSGVHARGQVIGFEIEWRHDLSDLHRALNAVLAMDVAITRIGLAPEGFHPRFSATSRAYRYTILNRKWRSPLERRTAWHVERELDADRMNRASQCLVGTHDFGAFGRPPQGDNTVRTIHCTEWRYREPFFVFDIKANAFLYRMVRSIVGMLVLVGSNQIMVGDLDAILQARDRSLIRQVAPAHGLCLMQVEYAMCEGVMQ